MAEGSEANPLVTWALATFNATGLVAVLVFVLHATGPLGDLLGGLDTLVGLALFVVLWATTWWTNRRWLAEVRSRTDGRTLVDALGDGLRGSGLVGGGLVWGATNGVLFFWGLFLLAVVPTFGFQVVPLSIIAVGGTLFALPVGALVGIAFATLDAGLLSVAGRLATDGAGADERL